MNYTAEDYKIADTIQLSVERNELAKEIGNYLYDVLMHRLSEAQILRGYMLYWVKFGTNLQDVHRDLHFRCTSYDANEIKTILAGIQTALDNFMLSMKDVE